MAVTAKQPGYSGVDRDREENFHGNQLLYIGWDDHMMFCAPFALMVPPDLPFGRLLSDVLPGTSFTEHPDWEKIDWNTVQWLSSGTPVSPDPAKSIRDNGLVHKSVLRMKTPGLQGLDGTRN